MAENLKNLISGLAAPAQTVEDAAANLWLYRRLAIATGENLNNYGRIVGYFPRPFGASDDEYRTLIYAKIQLNSSGGEIERLITAVKTVFGGSEVILQEEFPAGVYITTNAAEIPIGAKSIIDKMAAGGVSLNLYQVPEQPLGWEDENGVLNNDLPFSEFGETADGGEITERYI